MISINPENPSSDDNVVFEFVVFTNGCCGPETSVVGSHFYFEMVPIEPPPPVLGAHIPVEMSWPVGRLKAGEYQVTLIDPRDNVETQEFSVSQGELPFPEPAIPSIGFVGAIIIVVGLAWIANKAFKSDAASRAA